MKRYSTFRLLFLSAGLLLLSACTSDFEEINTNPNVPNAVSPNLLLPGIIRSTVNQVTSTAWGIGNIVMQHTAKIQFVNEDRYLWGEQNGIWNTMYTTMRDVNNMYVSADRAGQNNYKGIALIMKSWMFSLLTDAYGDVPYSEATRGKDKTYFPKYDRQEDIYNGILADLETANELLGSSAETVTGDILYSGNVTRWKKLANSLRLRYLMRISNRRDVSARMQAIIGNPTTNPIFENNADNAALRYLPTVPNQFHLYTSRIGSVDEVRLSKTLADRLKDLNDPRIAVFARPTVASVTAGKPEYIGVPNGLDDNAALQFNGGAQNVSRIGTAYYIDGFGTPTDRELNIARGIIMNYAELQFILAEAAQKGMITTGAARDYYEKGITASFNFYGLEVPAGYFEQPRVTFEAGNALQLIGTQKWIALFYSGLEAWFDWRRTGLPAITPGPANLNNNQVPVRFIYPTFEFSLNKENVEAAVAAQGPNTLNTPVWWDR
jgi:hypothetical protein